MLPSRGCLHIQLQPPPGQPGCSPKGDTHMPPACCLHDTRSSLPLPGLTQKLSSQTLLRQLPKNSGSAFRGLPTRSRQAAKKRSGQVAAAAGLSPLPLLLLAEQTLLTALGPAGPHAAAEGCHTSWSSATPQGGLLCLHGPALQRPHTSQAASMHCQDGLARRATLCKAPVLSSDKSMPHGTHRLSSRCST